MLVATIEIYPNGTFPPIKCAEIRVIRESPADDDIGDYTYGIEFALDGICGRSIDGKLKGYDRRLGATQLIKVILDKENVVYNPIIGTCCDGI